MIFRIALLSLLVTVGQALAAEGRIAPQADQTAPPLAILIGDSTLAPQTGYGQRLCERLRASGWDCLNLARGGRSTKSYRTEGLWDRALLRGKSSALERPTFFLIQFGHNDQPGKPGRSTDLQTEFPENLKRYVLEAKAIGATPVLMSPLSRRSFNQQVLKRDLKDWALTTQEVARSTQSPYVSLFEESSALVEAMGAEASLDLAMAPKGMPHFDFTHVGPKGACFFSLIVYRELQAISSDLKVARPSDINEHCASLPPPPPWPSEAPVNPFWTDHEGWAVGTLGGHAGKILRVTNLNASGPGSLREALEMDFPRIVVFEVAGPIDLKGKSIKVRSPFLTVAGQTAPSPGVTVIRGEITLSTHDVIIQHLSFRPGGYGREPRSGNDHDGLNVTAGAHKVIVDHCTFSWATDENLSIGGERFGGATPDEWRRSAAHEVTFSYNLIYEGLRHSVHPKGEHSKGTLVHDNATGVFIYRNIYASNQERNPLLKGGVRAAVVNNFIYNPGSKSVHYNLVAAEWVGKEHQTGRLALVGNVLRHGPNTRASTPLFSLGGAGDVEVYFNDNRAIDFVGQSVAESGTYTTSQASMTGAKTPYLPPRLSPLSSSKLETALMHASGARPWDRSPIDRRLLADVVEGRGQIIDREEEVGGQDLRTSTHPFDASRWNLHDMSPLAGWHTVLHTHQ